jgi:hypothetical protein
MLDKADIAAALLAIAGFLATGLYITLVPNAFNGALPGVGVFVLITFPIFSYAAYWAFSIRHALSVPLYRRQAFGIGFIILALWATMGTFILVPSSDPVQIYLPLTNGVFYFLFAVLFFWIDASVLASRRSDPLLRDVLYWTKIRIPFWIVNIIVWVIPLSAIFYGAIADTNFLNQLNNGTLPNSPAFIALQYIYNLPILVLICGLIYIPAIAIRSKWDKSLRRHFIWFAPLSIGLFLLFFNPAPLPVPFFAGHLLGGIVITVIGFTLYKSSKALVPMNRVTIEAISK